MAPRGRTRRTGVTRADAARENMRAYGFEMRTINQTLKELLEVYGEEGWILIEEASYKVLLDAILEKIEEQDKAERQDQPQKEHTEDGGGQMASNSTPVDVEPETNPNQDTGIGTQAYQADASSFTNEVAGSSLVHYSEGPKEELPEGLPAYHSEGGGVLASDVVEIGENSKEKETENITVNEEVDGNNVGMEELLGDKLRTERSSQPHNGWISSEEEEEKDDEDDDNEDAYVLLTPEPLSEELQRLLMEATGQRKRKTMWDVRPEEMNLVGTSAPESTTTNSGA